MTSAPRPFWQTTELGDMTDAQWESLCDGCGKCCLEKFEEDETGEIVYSQVACTLLDIGTCRCRDYANRAQKVHDCITLTLSELANPTWLPETCAYRRLAEGKALPDWHPLITGDPESVARAGESVRNRVLPPGADVDPMMHLIDWIR